MKIAIDVIDAHRLRKAMIYNAGLVVTPDIKKLYETMDEDELRLRAYQLYGDFINSIDPPVQRTIIHKPRREQYERYKPPRPQKYIKPPFVHKPVCNDIVNQLTTALYKLSYVESVVEPWPDCIVIRLSNMTKVNVIKKIVDEYGYKGEVKCLSVG